MEEHIEEALNLFKVDKFTKNLQNFHGNRNEVYRFIQSVDDILVHCEKFKKTTAYKLINENIRNKIVGKASESLTNYNINNEWELIKPHLIQTYADTRDIDTLELELFNLIKQDINPLELYNKIININTLLANQVNLKENSQEIKSHQLEKYRSTSLKVLMTGIKEPLGATLRARNPKTLNEAFNFINEEINILKLKHISISTSTENSQKPFIKNNPKQFRYNKNFPSSNYQQPSTSGYNQNFNPIRNQNSNYPNQNFNPIRNQNSNYPSQNSNPIRNQNPNHSQRNFYQPQIKQENKPPFKPVVKAENKNYNLQESLQNFDEEENFFQQASENTQD